MTKNFVYKSSDAVKDLDANKSIGYSTSRSKVKRKREAELACYEIIDTQKAANQKSNRRNPLII